MTLTTSAVGASEADVYSRNCATSQLLTSVSSRWVTLIVCVLGAFGSQRYGELSHRIDGVSPKMLTQALRSLERDGMVTRTVTPTVPVRVDYALTELGESLYVLLSQVRDWAIVNLPTVDAARAGFDAGLAEI